MYVYLCILFMLLLNAHTYSPKQLNPASKFLSEDKYCLSKSRKLPRENLY